MDKFFKIYEYRKYIRFRLDFKFIKFSFKTKNFFKHNNKKYFNYLESIFLKDKSKFVPISNESYNQKNSIKTIAYYLPQFHTIPLNDDAHGKGFTEWTNVAQAIPAFEGHHQPQIPIDVGFYDLSKDDVMYRQIELAKMYGINGFCFYYYWFSGQRLLEKPIFNYLNNKELDLPFCLCWANENWTKLWDGHNREVIMEQHLLDNDDEKFFYDILPFLKDDRYIKIDGKPILIIYRLSLFPRERIQNFINTLRMLAIKEGLKGIHISGARTFDLKDLNYNVDSWVEFPPHNVGAPRAVTNFYINKNYNMKFYDMRQHIIDNKYTEKDEPNLYKGVFAGWDNTARKALSNGMIYNCPPDSYKTWLINTIEWTKRNHKKDDQFIFINAWNEWAEGAHLEPDTHYGYAYLQATKEALEETADI